MKTNFTSLLVVAVLLSAVAPLRAHVHYAGEARDPDSGRLLYEEHHLLRTREGRPQERLVLYRCPGGDAFARKRVDYAASPAAPSFALEDARFGYREGVSREGDVLSAYYRADAGSRERRGVLEPEARLVIDAGFDEFVRAHWDALQRGAAVALDFVVPSRLDALGFSLRRVGATRVDGESASVMRLSLGGMLGWLAPDIDVTYRDRDRRLMRFEGLTNIRADARSNLVARIEFPSARELAASNPEDWQAAAAETLRPCPIGS